MCRNITALRGLQPEASPDEVRAAALQYVRKVGALSTVTPRTQDAVERAVERIAAATADLVAELPQRRQPPAASPPLRRLAARP